MSNDNERHELEAQMMVLQAKLSDFKERQGDTNVFASPTSMFSNESDQPTKPTTGNHKSFQQWQKLRRTNGAGWYYSSKIQQQIARDAQTLGHATFYKKGSN